MPKAIVGQHGRIRVGDQSWSMVLQLARAGGWKAAGTQPPETWVPFRKDGSERPWDAMDYTSSRRPMVTADDARNLADAAERMFDDIPNHDAIAHKVLSTLDLPFAKPMRVLDPLADISPLEFFCAEGKARLRRFIDFCHAGGFQIT